MVEMGGGGIRKGGWEGMGGDNAGACVRREQKRGVNGWGGGERGGEGWK